MENEDPDLILQNYIVGKGKEQEEIEGRGKV